MRRVVLLGALVVVWFLTSVPDCRAYSVGVSRINAAAFASVSSGATKGIVPALAVATDAVAAGGAGRWVALGISSAGLATIGQAVLWGAGLYAAGTWADQMIRDYWASKGYAINPDGSGIAKTFQTVTPNANENVPVSGATGAFNNGVYMIITVGTYSNSGQAAAACANASNGCQGTPQYLQNCQSGCTYSGSTGYHTMIPAGHWGGYYYSGTYSPGVPGMVWALFPNSSSYYTTGPVQYQPAGPDAAKTTLQNDLDQNNASALKVVGEALNQVQAALESNTNALNKSTSAMNSVMGVLNGSLTQAQKDQVTGQVGTGDWANDNKTNEVTVKNMITGDEIKAAVIAALAAKGLSQAEIQAAMSGALQANAALFSGGSGLTQAQIQSAIEEALTAKGLSYDGIINALTGVLGPASGEPYDPTALSPEALPDAPEKKSLPGVLSTFWEAFENLPVISLLNTFEVTASGSPVLTLSLPGLLGGDSGTANIDFSQWQDTFAVMGNVLLTIVGIRWTIYLFEG